MRRRALAFVFLLGAFIAAVVWLRRASPELGDAAGLLEALGAVRRSPLLPAAYLGLFGATTLLAPAFVFFVLAGALWGFWPGCLVGWLAASVWSNLHFAAGRFLFQPAAQAWLHRPALRLLRKELEEGGALAVVLVRQLPLPFVGVNAAAGASPMRWRRFALGNAVGLVPSATVYSWSAAAILEGVEGARADAALKVLGAAAAVLLLGVSSRLVQRWAQGHPPPP